MNSNGTTPTNPMAGNDNQADLCLGESREPAETKRPSLLVVDDSSATVDIMLEILSTDYEVAVATDGPSALEAAAHLTPDLILLDIVMVGMDGYEVCRRLKADQRLADIPVIFITAMTQVEDEAKGLKLGAVDYITKPISPPVVLARVATHLNLRRAYVQLEHQNARLKEYNRLRDEVERMSRHDLKAPLNAVISVPSLLLEEANLSLDQRELLEMLKNSGYRMLQIINSSLDLYKMEIGRYRPNPVPVDVIKLLVQVWSELREIILVKKLATQVTIGSKPAGKQDSFWVSGEEMLVYSMLANLIKNAVEASPEGERIVVSLENKNMALIGIYNQGRVPAEIRDRFFEKFSTSGKKGGIGLGAYTAKLITETLGGVIALRWSDSRGTMIQVELPLADSGELAARGERPDHLPAAGMDRRDQPPTDTVPTIHRAPIGKPATKRVMDSGANPRSSFKILIVDDFLTMRRLTKNILRRLGYTDLVEAEDGLEALNILKTAPVDIVISDINMPKMNGLQLLGEVRSDPELNNIPFILITAEADREIVLGAMDAKVTDYILKPYSPDLLTEKVDKVLRVRPRAWSSPRLSRTVLPSR